MKIHALLPLVMAVAATACDLQQDLGGSPTTIRAPADSGSSSDGGPTVDGGPTTLARSVSVAIDGKQVCAVMGDRSVECWGSGYAGDGAPAGIHTTPIRVPGLSSVGAVALGEGFVCALGIDGSVRCWGENDVGQVGDGSNAARFFPAVVQRADGNPLDGIEEISLGASHACARHASGRVFCWGGNYLGTLGDGSAPPSNRAVEVGGVLDASQLISAKYASCVGRRDGTVACWGQNFDLPAQSPRVSTLRAVVGLTDVRQIALSHLGLCALRVNGTVWCVGNNGAGEGAICPVGGFHPLRQVAGLGVTTAIFAGGMNVCALTAGGSAMCWGDSVSRQIGAAPASAGYVFCSPHSLPGGSELVSMGMGWLVTCARNRDGEVLCLGNNSWGQLGDGTTYTRDTATRVLLVP